MDKLKRKSSHNIFSEYDRLASEYPIDVFKDILKYSNCDKNDKILEIGCGTGKATEKLLQLGVTNITGIEIEYNLGTYLWKKFNKYKKFNINISSFEDWEGVSLDYDIVLSVNAFHFIPPEIGYNKAYKYLKREGFIGLFWSMETPGNKELDIQLRKIYRKYVPGLIDLKLPNLDDEIYNRKNEILNSNCFDNIKACKYSWHKEYTSDEYIKLLSTNPSYRLLDEEIRYKLFNEMIKTINQYGGSIDKNYSGVLLMGRKTSESRK
ncbi:class I SAM-dependent methyltransferase [Clostridium sp. D2Q-11]|uniref:Class I SAM-dependent methyltransferase n=1 Tax=Anaeromonas frigoriresistens TaxID=2683708 RepID=A0A942UZ52_9FIRM|nr:class I SAM-dependent methyltransferase [Anaeromonas frigoriresistens]MBS4537137.1 class I SAM-dependent methyltransferase [Anaeromonas frigoriresistens]